MNLNDLKDRIHKLSIWKKGDQRAPHKPLLILLALGNLQAKQNPYISYSEVKTKLTELLAEFGPNRQTYHPEEPFVRLLNDGIWQLDSPHDRRNPSNKLLLEQNTKGGFNPEVYSLLVQDRRAVTEIAEILLHEHFSETLHEDILRHVGLDLQYVTNRRHRDPHFRNKILHAYEYRCAVCGFNVRMGNHVVGLEAAHIKWHQAGGPDRQDNGIALCSMHHKLFVYYHPCQKVYCI